MMEIGTEKALRAIEAGLAKSRAMGFECSIAVVDGGRNLLAFARGDNAMLGSAELAQTKAFTAASFKMKTSAVAPVVQPGTPLFGLEAAGDRPYAVFGGGVPVLSGGRLLGAVGVSGGSVEDDEAVAESVAAALAK
jgi:uncharacterized protein GlcG (DUF336 family)